MKEPINGWKLKYKDKGEQLQLYKTEFLERRER